MVLLPIGDEGAAAEMRAGGMADEIDPVGIAAEARGVPGDGGDAAADPVDHRHQVAAGIDHVDEIENREMGAGAHERLRSIGAVGSAAVAPGAAMHEDRDRRRGPCGVGPAREVDIDAFDRSRAISDAPGGAEAGTHLLADGSAAAVHLVAVRRVFRLVVGVVEFLLVEVEPDPRPLYAGWAGWRLLGGSRAGSKARRGGSDHGSAAHPVSSAAFVFHATLRLPRRDYNLAGLAVSTAHHDLAPAYRMDPAKPITNEAPRGRQTTGFAARNSA